MSTQPSGGQREDWKRNEVETVAGGTQRAAIARAADEQQG
jgi:hypothetical protein